MNSIFPSEFKKNNSAKSTENRRLNFKADSLLFLFHKSFLDFFDCRNPKKYMVNPENKTVRITSI